MSIRATDMAGEFAARGPKGAAYAMTADKMENLVLRRLSPPDRSALAVLLSPFPLVRGAILHLPRIDIKHVYFPVSGMISMLTVTKSGEQIETGIVGREGVVGGSIGSFGLGAFGQSTVQISGDSLRAPAAGFVSLFHASESFRKSINAFQATIFIQAQQSAACHALHRVEARMARWLLQSQDVLHSDKIPLTQEFLSYMLGFQRTRVTVNAMALQKQGLIEYARGTIVIRDRPGLMRRACECYDPHWMEFV